MQQQVVAPPRWSDHKRHRFFRSLNRENDSKELKDDGRNNFGIEEPENTQRSDSFPNVYDKYSEGANRRNLVQSSNGASLSQISKRLETLENNLQGQMKLIARLQAKDLDIFSQLSHRVSTCETELLKEKVERTSNQRGEDSAGINKRMSGSVTNEKELPVLSTLLSKLSEKEEEDKMTKLEMDRNIQHLKQSIKEIHRDMISSKKLVDIDLSNFRYDLNKIQDNAEAMTQAETKLSVLDSTSLSALPQIRIMVQALAGEIVRLRQQNLEQEQRMKQNQNDYQLSSERLQELILAKEKYLDGRISQVKDGLITKSNQEREKEEWRMRVFEENSQQLRETSGERNGIFEKAIRLERERRIESENNLKLNFEMQLETIQTTMKECHRNTSKMEKKLNEFLKSHQRNEQNEAIKIDRQLKNNVLKLESKFQKEIQKVENAFENQAAKSRTEMAELEKVIRAEIKVRKSEKVKLEKELDNVSKLSESNFKTYKAAQSSHVDLLHDRINEVQKKIDEQKENLVKDTREMESNLANYKHENKDSQLKMKNQILARCEDLDKLIESASAETERIKTELEEKIKETCKKVAHEENLNRTSLEQRFQDKLSSTQAILRSSLDEETKVRALEDHRLETLLTANFESTVTTLKSEVSTRFEQVDDKIGVESKERKESSKRIIQDITNIDEKLHSSINDYVEESDRKMNAIQSEQNRKNEQISQKYKESMNNMDKLSLEMSIKDKILQDGLKLQAEKCQELISSTKQDLEHFKANVNDENASTSKKIDEIELKISECLKKYNTELKNTETKLSEDCKSLVKISENSLVALVENHAAALRLRIKTSIQAEAALRLRSLDELCEDFNKRTRNQERVHMQFVVERLASLRDSLNASIENETHGREEHIRKAQESLTTFVMETAKDIKDREQVTQVLDSLVTQVQSLYDDKRFEKLDNDVVNLAKDTDLKFEISANNLKSLAEDTSQKFETVTLRQDQDKDYLETQSVVGNTLNTLCQTIIEEDHRSKMSILENGSIERDNALSNSLENTTERINTRISELEQKSKAIEENSQIRDTDIYNDLNSKLESGIIHRDVANTLEYICGRIVDEQVLTDLSTSHSTLEKMISDNSLATETTISDLKVAQEKSLRDLNDNIQSSIIETERKSEEKIAALSLSYQNDFSTLTGSMDQLESQEFEDFNHVEVMLCMDTCIQKIIETNLFNNMNSNQKVTEDNMISLENKQELFEEKLEVLNKTVSDQSTVKVKHTEDIEKLTSEINSIEEGLSNSKQIRDEQSVKLQALTEKADDLEGEILKLKDKKGYTEARSESEFREVDADTSESDTVKQSSEEAGKPSESHEEDSVKPNKEDYEESAIPSKQDEQKQGYDNNSNEEESVKPNKEDEEESVIPSKQDEQEQGYDNNNIQ